MTKLTIIWVLLILGTGIYAQENNHQNKVKEWDDYFKGVYQLNQDDYIAKTIYNQLVSFSGTKFYVYYSKSFPWGQANYGGAILLDQSVLTKPIDVLAFIMAHEWAHEAMGHQANLFNPYGKVWNHRKGTNTEELAADEYAGKFLAEYDYNFSIVTNFIWNLSDSSIWNTNCSRKDRVRYLYKGSNSIDINLNENKPIIVNDSTLGKNIIINNCKHLTHPKGDVFPCVHKCFDQSKGKTSICHPNGDLIDCIHPLHLNCDTIR